MPTETAQTSNRHNRHSARQQIQPSRASVVETEIDYNDDDDDPTMPERVHPESVELQPYTWMVQRAGLPHGESQILYEDYIRRLTTPGHTFRPMSDRGNVDHDEIADIRHVLSNGDYEQQVEAYRLLELRRMQGRMAQAGYF